MRDEHFILVEADDDETTAGLQVQLEHARRYLPEEFSTRLAELTEKGELPAAVLLGPGLSDPVAVARESFRIAPLVQIVFLAEGVREADLRRRLALAPRIGTNWSLAKPTSEALRTIEAAARSTRQRLHYRTTLDRVRMSLPAPPAADAVDYRRLVLSDRYLGSLLAHARDAIFTTDPDGTVRTWNRGAARVFGHSERDTIGRPINRLLRNGGETLCELIRDVAAGTPEASLELMIRSEDGKGIVVDVAVAPVREEQGGLLGISVIARDVTDRYRAELEVREQRERLRVTLASIGDGVITTDAHGRVDYLNPVAEALTGWATAEAQGLPLTTVFRIENEETRIEVENPALRALRDGVIVGLANHTVLIAKDGTERPIDDSAAPIRASDGSIHGAVLVFRDISERKAAEVAAAEQLQLMALRADVASVLASSRKTTDALKQCCEALVKHLDAAFARVWTLDAEGEFLELKASAGLYTHLDGPHGRIRVGEFKIGRIAANREPHLTNSVPDDSNISDRVWARQEGMVAFAGYPLLVEGRVLGVMALFARRPLSGTILSDLAPLAESLGQYLDRRRSEERLRYHLDLTQAITDNATTAIFMMDAQSRCTFMNPAAEAMTGYSFDEVGGGVLHDFIHHHRLDGRPYPMRECLIDRALPEGGEVRDHEDFFIRKNGEFFPVVCNARVLYENEVAIGTVIEVRDITEAKRSELAAQHRSEQLRRLAEAASQLNVAHDVESVTGLVTEAARAVIGAHQAVTSMTAERTWAQAITAVSLSETYNRWRTYDAVPNGSGIYSLVCKANTPMRMTQAELEAHPAWRNFGGDQHHPPMRGWLAAPLVGHDGGNIGLIQLSDKDDGGDFTEDDEAVLVQLARTASVAIENARLYGQLRDADRRKDEFLATLAHELRNPLAPIRMGLEVLRLSGDDPETVQEMLDTMEGQVRQMVRLIDDLLDVSRITRGKLTLRKVRVDLKDAAKTALDAVRPMIEQARHDLSVSFPSEPLLVNGDPARLSQILSNLLNNAAKYTPDGGRISLKAERQEGTAVISVQDTGLGIPNGMLEKVFEMFTQIDRTIEHSHGGLGIGLHLVQKLVAMHGGTIRAMSAGEGQGSTFVVQLPLAAASIHSSQNLNETDGNATVRKVLIADDNRDAADMLGRVLRVLGHEVRVTYDGQQAVEAAAEFQPDVVLLDIGMPRLDGYGAAREIRKQPRSDGMLLIALTGWGQEEDRRRSAEAGFDRHLVKPVEPSELQKILASPGPAG